MKFIILSVSLFSSITGFVIGKKYYSSNSNDAIWQIKNDNIVQADYSKNVGIKSNASPIEALIVNGDIDNVIEGNTAMFTSSSTWHSMFALRNTSSMQQWTFAGAGSQNRDIQPNNFSLINTNLAHTSKIGLHIEAATNHVSVGYNDIYHEKAKSALTIQNGDVSIEQSAKGIILTSPNNTKWRVSINDNGQFIRRKLVNY